MVRKVEEKFLLLFSAVNKIGKKISGGSKLHLPINIRRLIPIGLGQKKSFVSGKKIT